MTLPHMIELGNLAMPGGEGSDGVYLSGFSGWDSLSMAKGRPDAIPQAHGSFSRVKVWRESKAPAITGAIVAPNRERAEELQAWMKVAADLATSMTVTDTTGRWTAEAEVESVDFSDPGAWSSYIPFTIDVLVTDPVRYSDPVFAGPVGVPVREGGLRLPKRFPWNFGRYERGRAVVENTGSLPVLPVVRLTGSAASLTVIGGARRLGFPAFSGELVFDSLNRRAHLNGIDATRIMTRRDWPVVSPGEVADFRFDAVDPSPDLELFVEYRIGAW